jgi:hypothetical protein
MDFHAEKVLLGLPDTVTSMTLFIALLLDQKSLLLKSQLDYCVPTEKDLMG